MPLHDRSFDPRRVFTRAEGVEAGLTPYELRTQHDVRVFRGVYVARVVPRTTVVRVRAALRVAPGGAVISHQTAAMIWGGDVERVVPDLDVPSGRLPVTFRMPPPHHPGVGSARPGAPHADAGCPHLHPPAGAP